jgi:glycosyltransferase involved in cell wall biosynthesis
MSLLYISANPIFPPDAGNRSHSRYIYKEISSHFKESHHILYGWRDIAEKYTSKYLAEFASHEIIDRPSLPVYQDKDNDLDEWVSSELIDACLNAKQKIKDLQTVLIDYVWLSKTLTVFASSCTKIINVHDLFASRRALMKRVSGKNSWFSLHEQDEARGLNRANICIFICQSDLEAATKTKYTSQDYKGIVSSTLSSSLLNESDTMPPHLGSINNGKTCLILSYVASSNDLNKSSANLFFESLNNSILKHKPSRPYAIDVYGNICKHLTPTPNLNLFKKGWTKDLSKVYECTHMALAPMASSTGMNVKVVEAIDNYIPIIATIAASKGSLLNSSLAQLRDPEWMGKVVSRFLAAPPIVQSNLISLLFRKCLEAKHANIELRKTFQNELGNALHTSLSIQHQYSYPAKLPIAKTVATASIIIPAYNTSEYIEECIKSLQDDELHDMEIIIVDDCSTDETYRICRELEKADSRIKVFQMSVNSGQAAARNLGLDVATGKYVYFVDSDDKIARNSVSSMLVKSEIENLDICFINRKDFSREDYSRISCFGAWQAMISRKIIDLDPPLRQPIVKSGQDGLFANMCLTRAEKIGFSELADYFYTKRDDSTFAKARKNTKALSALVEKQLHCLRSFYISNNLFPGLAFKYILFIHDETYMLRLKPVLGTIECDQRERIELMIKAELDYHNAKELLLPFQDELDPGFVESFL